MLDELRPGVAVLASRHRQAAASGLASYDDPLRHTVLRQAAYFFVAAGAGAFFAAGATGSGKMTVADLILSSSGKFLSR